MNYDMLEHVFPFSAQLYPLVGAGSNETCRTRTLMSGYRYFDKNENWEEGWGDENFVYRGFDISSFRHNEVYCLFTKLPDNSLRYGSAWLPRYMSKGQVFPRTAWVRHYDAQGNIFKEALVTTYAKLVEYHAVKQFESGRSVTGVAELQYGFNPDVSDVREHYFYGKGIGLVGFEDGVIKTFIGQGTPTDIKPQTVIPWIDKIRPTIPPKEIVVSAEKPSGVGKTGAVDKIPGAYVNIRTKPSPTGIDVGDLKKGDVVTFFPDQKKTDELGVSWVYVIKDSVAQGWVSEQKGAVVILEALYPAPPESEQVTITLFGVTKEERDKFASGLRTVLEAMKGWSIPSDSNIEVE